MEQQSSDLAIEHLDNPDDASSKGSSMGKFNTITSHVIKLIPVKNDNRMAYLSPPINDFSNAKLKKRQSFDKVILYDESGIRTPSGFGKKCTNKNSSVNNSDQELKIDGLRSTFK